MDLKEIMKEKVWAVVGNTLAEEKYAYKIKNDLIARGYEVYAVGKELKSINDIDADIDIIDLCIHPALGIKLLKECKKTCDCVLIQPGAESDEIIQFLEDNKIDYLEGCALVGMSLYA